MTQIQSHDLSYPVIFLLEDGFQVWRNLHSLMGARALGGRCEGLLIDRDGRSYKVIRAESPSFFKDGRWLAPGERTFGGETFVCEGEPHSVSLEKLRQRIVWHVSARGNFESPAGFGLSAGVGTAITVWELLEALGESLNSHLP